MEDTSHFTGARLSQAQFTRIGQFIEVEFGIKMPGSKKVMLESRLHKRLRDLKMKDFTQYCDYLFSKQGFQEELTPLLNVVTTNKTDFFREPAHFELLQNKILPVLYSPGRSLRIWSAGCSSGEEPYTLAMVLLESGLPPGAFGIYATDISSRVLEIAIKGIYEMEKISDVPFSFRQRYMLKSKEKTSTKVRMKPEIRSLISYKRFNLLGSDYSSMGKMDLIFCRNVLIYFQREVQLRIIQHFYEVLKPGGFLFLGHSETLCNMDVPLRSVAPTVYRRV